MTKGSTTTCQRKINVWELFSSHYCNRQPERCPWIYGSAHDIEGTKSALQGFHVRSLSLQTYAASTFQTEKGGDKTAQDIYILFLQ